MLPRLLGERLRVNKYPVAVEDDPDAD